MRDLSGFPQYVLRVLVGFLSIYSSFASAITDYKPFDKQKAEMLKLSDEVPVQIITVKFKDEHKIRFRLGALASVAENESLASRLHNQSVRDARAITEIAQRESLLLRPAFGQSELQSLDLAALEERNDKLKQSGESKSNVKLADLNNFYSLAFPQPVPYAQVESIVHELNALETVEIAYAEPPVDLPVVNTVMPGGTGFLVPSSSVQGSQGYLANTNNGVHALAGWLWRGAAGSNVKVLDIETAINPYHEDLTTFDLIHWWSSMQGSQSSHHGTAVMGVLVGEDNGFGVTGISHQATWGFWSSHFCLWGICDFRPWQAITNAIDELDTGDIMILEMHVPGPALNDSSFCNYSSQCNYVPVEWGSSTFAATQTAVANGIVVVAAAGNGYADLDDSIYGGNFDLNVRDSGAIIVGAVEPFESSGVSYFSNYGSRVNARGWGGGVGTLGYSGSHYNEMYRSDFGGTSSATPIVAGAAANIQSIAIEMGRNALTSVEMRDLISTTGTPQTYDLTRSIGVMPNIDAAAKELQSELLECTFGSGTAVSGYWSAYGMEVKNISGSALSSWAVYLDFQGNPPAVTSITGGTATVSGDRIIIEGGALGTGASAYFNANGTYSGPGYISFSCF